MASYSVELYGNLFGAKRLDAEFYQPRYKENESFIARHSNTVDLGRISRRFNKGIFDIRAEEYVPEGIPFVRINNLKNGIIDEDNIAYISPGWHQKEQKTSLKKYDLVLSKTAYPAASLVQLDDCNTSQDTIAVSTVCSESFNCYLAVFLNTIFGLLQMERLFQGNVQMHLSLPDARTIKIPVPPENFQDTIRGIFEKSIYKRQESRRLYSESQSMLLRALRLDSLNIRHQTTYTAMSTSVWAARRLDAEYFQPKYQEALAIMSQSGMQLRDYAPPVKQRFVPQPGELFEYIEIGNLTRDGRAESETVMGEDAPSRAQWIVHPNYIITSTVRPIRRLSALIEDDQDNHVCSSGFAVLKPKEELVSPELLLLYLRLPIVCEILDLSTTASMYPAISLVDLLSLPVTLPDHDVQRRIVSRVRESRQALKQANALWEDAKRRVQQMVMEA